MSIPVGNQLVLASSATGSVALMDVQYIKGAFKVYDTAADLADVIVAQISDNQIIWLEESSSLYQATVTPADPFNGIPDATVTWSAFQFPGSGGSTPTGSLLTTASLAGSDLTFTKGDGNTFTLTLPGDSAETGSLLTTASAANNIITFTKGDGNTFAITVDTGSGGDSFPYTGSAIISGSLKTIGVEASHLDGQFDLTSSIIVTAAAPTSNNRYASQSPSNVYYLNGIEAPYIKFFPGKSYIFDWSGASSHPVAFYLDAAKNTQYTTGVSTPASNQTQISVTENTPSILYYMCTAHPYMGNAAHMESSAVSASLAQTASYVETAQTASYVVTAQTASYVETAQTASYVLNAVSASYAISASHEIVKEVSSSYADTASYVETAQTASYVLTAQTASYVETAQTASYVLTAQTASFVTTAQTASYVETAQTASYILNAVSASYIEGKNVSGAVTSSISSSLALNNVLTASAANNIITFTKGDGNTFNLTIDTGSAGDSFPYTGSAIISGSLGVTGSINATTITSSFQGDLDGTASTASYVETAQTASFVTTAQTASYVETAQTASFVTTAQTASYVETAQTASYVLNAVSASYVSGSNVDGAVATASYVETAQTASFVTTAQTASYVETAQTASYVLNAVSASYAISASHEIVKEVSSSYADTAEVARGLENTPSIAVTNITASGPISSSGALFISASENNAVDKVALYNDTTGQLFYTASSALGGGATIKATGSGLDGGSPGGDVSTITIQDYDTNVVVQYNAGDLKFIFGEPTAPTPSIAQSGFQTDKFNLELQTYTVTGTFGLGGYSLVSASLFSGSTQLETGDSGETLSRTFTNVQGPVDGGQFSYSLQVTSSNPVTSAEDKQVETLNLSLNKLNPAAPSFDTLNTSLVEDGVVSGRIEYNATGSISYTGSKSSTDRNWTFVSMSANVTYAPIAENNSPISGSVLLSDYNADGNIDLRLTAHYNSSTLNNPVANASINSSLQRYQRTRSVRTVVFPTSQTSSFEADYFNISLLEKSGSINRGTVNPNNLSVSLTGTSTTEGNYQYILIDNTYTLSAIEIGGNDYLTSTFNNTYSTNSGWKIYKSNELGSGTTTYLLKT